jgi:hypothetical protein
MAADTPPTVWSDAVAPGGEVCAVLVLGKPEQICGMPVESEPCPEHARCVRETCGHDGMDHDAGECWAVVDGVQCPCSWYTPAWTVDV